MSASLTLKEIRDERTNARSEIFTPNSHRPVGVGNSANRGHLPVLSLLPDYEIVAVLARRMDAAEAAAKRFGVKHVLGSAKDCHAGAGSGAP